MKHKFVSAMSYPYFREALVVTVAKAVAEAMAGAMVKALAMMMTEAIAESGWQR